MYIQRDIESKFMSFFEDKEILAVIGPRQAGKTTFIKHILERVENKKINSISFDNISIRNMFEENIEAFIEKEIKGYDIVFIDEIQYSKNSGQKLKYIYDTIENVKIIISGSSSVDLSLNSIKYLVGRIIVFELQTLSFDEFLRFKDEKLYNIYEKKLFSREVYKEINKYLEEYILYGGYPRVVLESNESKKIEILKNIFNTYLLKEISEILKYKENRIIEKLVTFLAYQIGNVINYNDLSEKVGVSVYEIKNALSILEKTFICSFSSNFSRNKHSELIKSPKIFFNDLGFRNYVFGNFNNKLIEGNLYENFIATQLLRKELPLKYWRTKSGAEVDFIIERNQELLGIEVKTHLSSNVVGKSMMSFINKYEPNFCYVISKDFKDERQVNEKTVSFLPYVELLREI